MSDMTAGADAARNKALVSQLYETVYNRYDVQALKSIFAVDYVEHNPELGSGLPAMEAFLTEVFALCPDIHFTLVRLVAEDDLVVAHALMRRTPEDHGAAIAEIFRFARGKVIERWDVTMRIPEGAASGTPVV